MAVELYLYDTQKRLRRVIVWGCSKLIHDERDFLLTAEILNDYAAKPGEFLGFECDDGRFRLFEIEKAVVNTTGGFASITATEAAVSELAHSIVEEVRFESTGANAAASAALSGSGFMLGKTADGRSGEISKYFSTRWKVLREIESVCNVRVLPYYTVEGGVITGKVVDIETRTYRRTGRILQRETDATNVQITYSGIPIVRMYGVGKSTGTEDPPSSVTFKDVVWSRASGDPFDKPEGQAYLEDPDAINEHGSGREDVYENKNVTDANELIRLTYEELQKRRKPQVSGVATAFDVAHIPGYEHKSVRMYDILDVPTDDGGTVEGKVIDVQRNYLRPDLTQITLGEEKESDAVKPIDKQVASLMNQTTSLRGSSGAAASRYLENKHLIQLNANRIIMNAEEILANAERITLTTSNLERYQAGTDEALNELGIIMDSYEAELLLYAKQTTVDSLEKEVYIKLDAAEEEIALKANKVYVDAQITEVKKLVAEEIEAAKGEIENAYLATVSTNELFALKFVFNGSNVNKTPITVVTGVSGGGVDSANYTLMTTAEGDIYTMELGSADPVYSNGVQAKYIQGEEYTGTLYQPGSTFGYYERGDEVTSSLYYSGGSEKVTLQGSEYTSTVYTKSGSTYTMVTIPLFREGSSKTFYKRGSLYSGALFKDGGYKTITKQGDMHTGALFNQGPAYSGGLYTNFEPGIVTMKPVTALTA